jgi:hypothetical protein
MKIILKKELLENVEHNLELDELASKVEHGYDSKGRSKYDIIKDKNGVTVGYKIWDNNSQEKIPILMVCGGPQLESLVSENEDMLAQLRNEFPDTTIRWSNEKKSVDLCYPPRRRNWSLESIPGEHDTDPHIADTRGEHDQRPAETTIKRLLNAAVVDVLGTDEVSERLNKCSLPSIKGRERSHINNYGRIDNLAINYDTHNNHTYKDVAEFISAVNERVSNQPVSVRFDERHLARNYVQANAKWNETRMMNIRYGKDKYRGKTDVYKLDRFGLNPNDDAVTIRTDLSIRGHRDVDDRTYTWKIIFKIKFGNRLESGFEMYRGRLGEFKELEVENTVSYDHNESFNDTHTVLDSRFIYQGLIQSLTDMKAKFFKDIKPIQSLGMPTVAQQDISESIAKSVINFIKSNEPPIG